MSSKYLRDIYVYGTDFWDFYNAQTKKVQDKIDSVIDLVRTLPMIPERFFKTYRRNRGAVRDQSKIR